MLIMIRLALSEEEMVDIAEALDDPMLPENQKTKLLRSAKVFAFDIG